MSWVLLLMALVSLVLGMITEVTGKSTWAVVAIMVVVRVLVPLGFAALAAWVYVS
jgi:hypothetical protein